MSLDDLLLHYGVELPACTQSSVRYSLEKQGLGQILYLHFKADRTCMDGFLRGNGQFPGVGVKRSTLPIKGEAGWGWPTSSVDCDQYSTKGPGGKRAQQREVILAVCEEEPLGLYLRAMSL